MKSIVIIGAGMAGARACINLREQGYGEAITLLGEEVHLPYDRPPLSKAAITQEAEPAPVWLMDEVTARELKVDVRKGVAATSISCGEKAVGLSNGTRDRKSVV